MQCKPALYCWSHAEAALAKRAAFRHQLNKLDGLPWYDLSKSIYHPQHAYRAFGTTASNPSFTRLVNSPLHCVNEYQSRHGRTQAQVMAWSAHATGRSRSRFPVRIETIMAPPQSDVLSVKRPITSSVPPKASHYTCARLQLRHSMRCALQVWVDGLDAQKKHFKEQPDLVDLSRL